jgi:hypothetical protein
MLNLELTFTVPGEIPGIVRCATHGRSPDYHTTRFIEMRKIRKTIASMALAGAVVAGLGAVEAQPASAYVPFGWTCTFVGDPNVVECHNTSNTISSGNVVLPGGGNEVKTTRVRFRNTWVLPNKVQFALDYKLFAGGSWINLSNQVTCTVVSAACS